MNLAMKIILGVLVVAALFLGYKIYEKKTGGMSPVTELGEGETRVEVDATSIADETGAIPAADAKILRADFNSDASAEEKEKYFNLINKYAVATTDLDISNCNSQPFVTEIKQGDSLTLINNYPKSQTVRIGMNIEHTVEANSSKVIKADFGYGAGSYGFSCQTKPGVAGIIVTRDISN